MSVLLRLSRSSAIYITALLASGGISFGLLAVFTRYLSPGDFGVLAVLGATIGIVGSVVGLNPVPFFTARFPSFDDAELRRFSGAAVATAIATASAAYGVLELLGRWVEAFRLPTWVLAGIPVLGMVAVLRGLGLTVFKMRRQPGRFATLKVGETALAGGLGVLLVVILRFDWRGKFLGQLLAGVLAAASASVYLWRTGNLGLRTSVPHLREYIRFSLPVVPHSLGFWAINAQDRYFVLAMSGLEAAGVYTVGYSLARVLDVANRGVLNAFSPHFYGRFESGEGKNEIVLLTYGYLLFTIVAFVVFVLVMKYVAPVFVGPEFVESSGFVPWVAAGYSFNALRNFMTGYLYVAEKTKILAGLTVAAAALNAGLNFMLIRALGPIGAAVATAVTFAVLAGATVWIASRVMEMPWKGALVDLVSRSHKLRGPQ